MLVHRVVTNDLLVNSIIPIPKHKNGGHSDFAIYRGIALSLILGKIFDRILLNRYSFILITSQVNTSLALRRITTWQCALSCSKRPLIGVAILLKVLSSVQCLMQQRALIVLDTVSYCAVLFRGNCHSLF